MSLYLVRHGEAVDGDVDPERPLTARGRADVSAVARHAVEENIVAPRRIVHSGKARAQQTAEVWAEVSGAPAEAVDGLKPNDDPATWADRVDAAEDGLMLVGHLPHLERLAGLLVTGDAARPVVGLTTAEMVVLDHGPEGWTVSAKLAPGDR